MGLDCSEVLVKFDHRKAGLIGLACERMGLSNLTSIIVLYDINDVPAWLYAFSFHQQYYTFFDLAQL